MVLASFPFRRPHGLKARRLPGLRRVLDHRDLGEDIPDPQAVFNTSACDRTAYMTCLAASPRPFPFLLPSPADRSGGVVVIPCSGVFSGGVYELAEDSAHLAPPLRASCGARLNIGATGATSRPFTASCFHPRSFRLVAALEIGITEYVFPHAMSFPPAALLRSRPAVVRGQPLCASHHHEPHTGKLSTTAQTAIATGPGRPATTDAAIVATPSPIPAAQARRL